MESWEPSEKEKASHENYDKSQQHFSLDYHWLGWHVVRNEKKLRFHASPLQDPRGNILLVRFRFRCTVRFPKLRYARHKATDIRKVQSPTSVLKSLSENSLTKWNYPSPDGEVHSGSNSLDNPVSWLGKNQCACQTLCRLCMALEQILLLCMIYALYKRKD